MPPLLSSPRFHSSRSLLFPWLLFSSSFPHQKDCVLFPVKPSALCVQQGCTAPRVKRTRTSRSDSARLLLFPPSVPSSPPAGSSPSLSPVCLWLSCTVCAPGMSQRGGSERQGESGSDSVLSRIFTQFLFIVSPRVVTAFCSGDCFLFF